MGTLGPRGRGISQAAPTPAGPVLGPSLWPRLEEAALLQGGVLLLGSLPGLLQELLAPCQPLKRWEWESCVAVEPLHTTVVKQTGWETRGRAGAERGSRDTGEVAC